jgi:hypothetical protein
VDAGNRAELREELAHLRVLYLDAIDELAMAFGVPQAMKTKEDVERTVMVPKDMIPPLKHREQEQLYF